MSEIIHELELRLVQDEETLAYKMLQVKKEKKEFESGLRSFQQEEEKTKKRINDLKYCLKKLKAKD